MMKYEDSEAESDNFKCDLCVTTYPFVMSLTPHRSTASSFLQRVQREVQCNRVTSSVCANTEIVVLYCILYELWDTRNLAYLTV